MRLSKNQWVLVVALSLMAVLAAAGMIYALHRYERSDNHWFSKWENVCIDNDLEGARRLISGGRSLNGFEPDLSRLDTTPLTTSLLFQREEIARMLIEAGVDLHKGDPLCWAVCRGQRRIAELILSKGVDVDEVFEYGHTALTDAAQNGSAEGVGFLIDHGAKINGRGYGGATALCRAAQFGHRDAVKVLIAKGADVNLADDEGNTPLHGAARNGYVEIVRLLLDAGADPNLKNKDGHTPLQDARDKKHEDVAALLQQKGGHE